ncbi:hypothetical protein PRBEI_2001793100 [Prionailurus iriomotensis]
MWTGRICYHFVPICRQTWKGAFSDVKRLMPTMQVKEGYRSLMKQMDGKSEKKKLERKVKERANS